MATQSPFSLAAGLVEQLGAGFQPPPWMIDELQHRLVLFLNHVLMQEPEAQARLVRQKGRRVRMQWRGFGLQFCATPAGLLEIEGDTAQPDLSLTVIEESPFALAQAALRGDKPAVRVEGDVQLAAEVNWLVDHVRWDIEEDLSRLIGDAPAHALGRAARGAAQALQQFVRARPWPGADKAPA
jgi:ubiquinone biosynthesis accessory factor UbiJ